MTAGSRQPLTQAASRLVCGQRTRPKRNTVSGCISSRSRCSTWRAAGEAVVKQRGEQRPIRGGKPNPLAVHVPLQHGDLVPADEDLRNLVPVTHGQQPQQREPVGHAEIGQSKQHGGSSSRSDQRLSKPCWRARRRRHSAVAVKRPLTSTDEVLGTRRIRMAALRVRPIYALDHPGQSCPNVRCGQMSIRRYPVRMGGEGPATCRRRTLRQGGDFHDRTAHLDGRARDR